MSTATESTRKTGLDRGNWRAGVLGGIVGAAVMGGLVVLMNDAVIGVAIPSMYGLAPPQNPGLGLVVHVSHGAVLGVVFAGFVGAAGVDSTGKLIGVGAVWGVLTWAVLANPPFPNFAPPSLLWHVVYGVLLGGVYAGLEDRI
ncbi:histidine kinase [Halobacteriales archaeon SW_12_69_24]|nr:MAG: histidine kinase [Halobacteriales archaeon SW_12_69_24]